MAKIDGGRVFAKALKREGVETIFTLVGGHITPFFYGCRQEGIKIIDFRHECDAAYAADAYARVTGKPGVLLTTAGPGVTNTITAMEEALYTGVPVVHIGGASPARSEERGDLQDMNTFELLAACTKWSRKVYEPARFADMVAIAFRQATATWPGPVYLEVPADTLRAILDEDEVYYPKNYRTDALPFGDPELIEKAADLLISAQAPVMVVGETSRYSTKHGEAVEELANYLKIPVMSSVMARGLFADEAKNPLFKLGMSVVAADVVLTLGLNNDWYVNALNPPVVRADAKIIQVHTAAEKIGWNAPAEIGIIGGTGPVAKQLLDAVKAKTPAKEDMTWVNKAAEVAKTVSKGYLDGFVAEGVPVHPGRCAGEVAKFLAAEYDSGNDWNLVADGGDSCLWMRAASTIHRPGGLVSFGPNGTIGVGAGFVVGAWASNDKPVLWYTGDGSFGFYTMEMDTMAKQGIPVVCVISNDSAWGMIKMGEKISQPEEIGTNGYCGVDLCHMRDYHKLPETWGGYGELVTKAEDIIPAIKRAAATGKPSIINVEVDKVNMTPATQAFGQGLAKSAAAAKAKAGIK